MNLAPIFSFKKGPDVFARPASEGSDVVLFARRENTGGLRNHISSLPPHRKLQPRGDYNLPHNGNVLPRPKLVADDVAKGQAKVLQTVFGRLKSPAKEMARTTGISERACRNQLAGLNSMNLADFFNACQTIPELRPWGAQMMGMMAEQHPAFQAELARGRQEIVLRIETGGITLGKADSRA